MSNKYNVVIIGSGLGGLVCGYILSKNGLRVAIVEKKQPARGMSADFCTQRSQIRDGDALHRQHGRRTTAAPLFQVP